MPFPRQGSDLPPASAPRQALTNGAKIRVAATALALVALIFAAFWTARPRHAASLVGGAFALQATSGGVLTDADMKGKPFLVFFGYTHCPDICPTTLAQISAVLQKLGDKPIAALFITFDPERDTLASLKDYLGSFDPRIVGLTGDARAVEQAVKAYRVYAKKVPLADGDYTMDHTSLVYFMDADGGFIEALDLERKAEDVAKEIAGYL